jgi:uncharacterized protein (DUF2236 family)
VKALLWVYSTLVESALIAHDCVLPPLSTEEREVYYAESRKMAALFGIPAHALPRDWSEFAQYNRSMVESGSLGVSSLSRELAHGVLHGSGSWVPVPEWYRALTAAWLPEPLRVEFALEYGAKERDAAARAVVWLPRIYPRLPATARFVGPYRAALARLDGRRSGPLIGMNNRFWMGQPTMMFSELEH